MPYRYGARIRQGTRLKYVVAFPRGAVHLMSQQPVHQIGECATCVRSTQDHVYVRWDGAEADDTWAWAQESFDRFLNEEK